MCRIAGIADKSLQKETLFSITKLMCDVLRHGGPDDEGIYLSLANNLCLGNRRLSIIDLSINGHQPMSYEGRFQITYNGEIYNHLELKRELQDAGMHFRGTCDTEVILAAFSYWGEAALSKLKGMFAFALLDQQTENLYLARDVSGIKPLYYHTTTERIVFASEVKAFNAVPYLQECDEDWQIYMMAYGHLPDPATTLKNVTPLAKGCVLKYHLPSGNHTINAFASSAPNALISDKSEAEEQLRYVFGKAVKRHLFSDAPIGVFLSGGLDSAIIAKLAATENEVLLNTLSIFFEEEVYSEKNFQDTITANLASSHRGFLLQEKQFHEHLPAIINDMDLPSSDGINTWFISKYAKDSGLKAVLSGIGADEYFGGYPSFGRMNRTAMLEKLPNAILRSGRVTQSKILRRLCYLSLHNPQGKYLFLRGHFIPVEIAAYLGATEKEVWHVLEKPLYQQNIDHLSAKEQASWLEVNFYMQNQLLRDADVMSMIHGLEIRLPYLDIDFINLVLSIAPNIKFSGPLKKQLLIDAFRKILPESVWNRSKMGFSFPFKEWFKNDEYIKTRLNRTDKKGLNYFSKFEQGHLHWSQLMTLTLLEKPYAC